MSHPLRLHGKMSLELDLDILARLESLEHFSNQQSILLDAVLSILEKGMSVNTATRSFILPDTTGESM